MSFLFIRIQAPPLKIADSNFLVFIIEYGLYALPLEDVECVLPAAELTDLPASPDVVLGVLNYRGSVLPTLDTRQRFRLPKRETQLSDVFILAHSRRRPVLLRADTVRGVESYQEEDIVATETIAPDLDYLSGVIRRSDGLVLIHDLDAFLSLDEDKQLQKAVAEVEERR